MISFVIPAYNEADMIGRCVESIHRYAPIDEEHEIIVVDNGSQDDTVAVATAAGARVIVSEATSISGVRNEGAALARGNLFVFLDGDCLLTEEWALEVPRILTTIRTTTHCCAGSQVTPPDEPVFLWKYWFIPFFEKATTLGSAHMMCQRATFEEISGFNEELETGEDYDFCVRVIEAGGYIVDDPALKVEHYGFPRTWRHFMRRERWHGRGDVTSLSTYLGSKVAIASTLFGALFVGSVLALLLGAVSVSGVSAALAAMMLASASALRFRHRGLATKVAGVGIFAAYFLARSMSVVDALVGALRRRT